MPECPPDDYVAPVTPPAPWYDDVTVPPNSGQYGIAPFTEEEQAVYDYLADGGNPRWVNPRTADLAVLETQALAVQAVMPNIAIVDYNNANYNQGLTGPQITALSTAITGILSAQAAWESQTDSYFAGDTGFLGTLLSLRVGLLGEVTIGAVDAVLSCTGLGEMIGSLMEQGKQMVQRAITAVTNALNAIVTRTLGLVAGLYDQIMGQINAAITEMTDQITGEIGKLLAGLSRMGNISIVQEILGFLNDGCIRSLVRNVAAPGLRGLMDQLPSNPLSLS